MRRPALAVFRAQASLASRAGRPLSEAVDSTTRRAIAAWAWWIFAVRRNRLAPLHSLACSCRECVADGFGGAQSLCGPAFRINALRFAVVFCCLAEHLQSGMVGKAD